TGDFHAIASAHNLLSAMLDAHLHHGNALGLDTRRITWPRTIDMNDRALRSLVVGLGGLNAGPAREERFVIIPGSEIMAIMALATALGGPGAAARAHHRGAHDGEAARARERPQGPWGQAPAAQGRDQSQPRADARRRTGVHSLRAVRQHRPRL